MGVDYSSVGGIGLELTESMIEAVTAKGLFTEEEWEEDPEGCVDELGICYECAGNCYSGEQRFYFLVMGNTLKEVNANSDKFVAALNTIGIVTTVDDLEVISDMYVY